MIVTVVYQSPDGLVPLQIVEALARQFGTQTTTKQVLKIKGHDCNDCISKSRGLISI